MSRVEAERDFAGGRVDLAELVVTAGGFGVSVEWLTDRGPGGDWPLLRFAGEADRVRAFLREVYDEDEEDWEGGL